MPKTIAVLGSALFFAVAPSSVAGLVPWWITHWEFRPPFFDLESALRKMRKATNGPWVLETERGGPLTVDAMQYIVREAGKLAGLGDELHPHMLRHGAGYALINDGVDVRLVQEFLGHASITSTAIYTAISPKRLAAVRVR